MLLAEASATVLALIERGLLGRGIFFRLKLSDLTTEFPKQVHDHSTGSAPAA
jgi:hypothetical protein